VTSGSSSKADTPAAIWRYYERVKDCIEARRRVVLIDRSTHLDYAGLSNPEIEDAFAEQFEELDHQVTCALIASFEAAVCRDFRTRCKSRKTAIGRKCKDLYKRKKQADERVTFVEVLDIWSGESKKHKVTEELKKLYRFRHWLAHGRWFPQKSGLAHVDPERALEIGEEFFHAHPDVDVEVP